MVRVGNDNTGILTTWEWTGVNTYNMVAARFTMPEQGDIYRLHCYFAGDGVSVNARLLLWNANGDLVRQSNQFVQPSGSRVVRGQSWADQDIDVIRLNQGEAFYVGFWRDPSKAHVISLQGSGGTNRYEKTATSPTDIRGALNLAGQFCMFIDYNPVPPPPKGGIPVWDGGSWTKRPLKVWDGVNWQRRKALVWDGSSWVWKI